MKTIYKLILIPVVILLFSTGCKKEFLEVKPINQVTEASFYLDTANVLLAISGAYNAFEFKNNPDLFDVYRLIFGDIAADVAESGGDGGPLAGAGFSLEIDRLYAINPDNRFLSDLYGFNYIGISRCTEIIEFMGKLADDKKLSANTAANIKMHIGEAYFLRAAYYFVLTRLFGGVQIVDHVLSPEEYKSIGRSTIKEVYDFMESDLKNASDLLPDRWPGGNSDAGRVTKGSAISLLAKMYVYESSYFTYYGANDPRMGAVTNRWAEALQTAESVISSGRYRLVGIDGDTYPTFWSPKTNGYRYIFSVEGNNNEESIFAIQHVADIGSYNHSVGNMTNQWVAVPAIYLDTTFKVNPAYDQDHAVHDHSQGWGWFVPSKKLFNAFEPQDVRRKVTCLAKGDSVYAAPRLTHNGTQDANPTPGWYYAVPCFDEITGYTSAKYEIGPWISGVVGLPNADKSWFSQPQNMYYLRYADVVLLAAEAAMMTGDQTKARTYLNMVRKRARVCGNGKVPADITHDITKEDIINERMLEFGMEGERFYDLVRWHEAKNVINNTVLATGDVVVYEEPKNDFYPLPQTEMQKNKNLTQYQGW